MLLHWKVTVYDKHTIPSCQEIPDSFNPSTLLLATICRAIHCTAHHCTHISVTWLWKSFPTTGVKTLEKLAEFGFVTFFATSLTQLVL